MEPLFWQINKRMESGTHGRKWYTQEANNIAFSFGLEVDCEIERLEGISLEIAVTLVEVFQEMYHICLEIKEPNDLVYHQKKLGGILTQTKLQGKKVKYLVIGIRHQHFAGAI